jgi:acyl-CoA synthetase (AMP-forming)/AMP-acid ligase II
LATSSSADLTPLDAVLAELTAPGAKFEIETDAAGRRNFVQRPRTMTELLVRAATRGERDFVVDGERRLSYTEFAELSFGTGAAMIGILGVHPADRVAILAHNGIDWLVAAFGASAAGGIVVGLNWSWTPAELEAALQTCGARFLVVSDELLPRARAVAATGRTDLRRIVVIDGKGDDNAAIPESALADLVAPASAPPDVAVDEHDPFALVFTSGTTGTARACITTHAGTIVQTQAMVLINVAATTLAKRAAAAAAPGGDAPRPAAPQPALLTTSPLFHISSLHAAIGSSLWTGSKVVFAARGFDAVAALKLIEQEQITAWGAVPAMVERVLALGDLSDYDLSSLASLAIGGAPLRPATLERAREVFGPKLRLGHGYGMTEAHGGVTMNAGRDLAAKPGSVGVPNPMFDLRIVDESGAEVPRGEPGEIILRGVAVTPGYWDDPAGTAATVRDGWLHTGDAGFLDADGALYLVDRIKDIVIRGGENISSVEVAQAIARHPAVADAAVFGLADDELGERVAAAVELAAGASATEDELREHARAYLATFKVPDRIWILDEPLPRNAMGKVLKAEVRRLVGLI